MVRAGRTAPDKPHPASPAMNRRKSASRRSTPFAAAGLALCFASGLVAQSQPSEGTGDTVEVAGITVPKEFEADAKRGIFHIGKERVGKTEALALLAGKVRHPVTGELIDPEDAERAKTSYLTHDGRWLDEAAADKYHTRSGRPWVVRTRYGTVIAPLPLKTIREKIVPAFDAAVQRLIPITGAIEPHPDYRPAVLLAPGADAYVQFGDQLGSGEDAYGCFLPQADLSISGARRFERPVIANWVEGWGDYYVRHAAALAWTEAFAASRDQALPNWFHRAAGGLASLQQSDYYTAYFGGLALGRGEVPDLAKSLPGLALSGDMDPSEMNDKVFMAALALDFGMRGGNKDVTKALLGVTEAFKNPEGAFEGPMKAFCKSLAGQKEALASHLQGIIKAQQKR